MLSGSKDQNMKKCFPIGMLALLASALFLHGAVEASNPRTAVTSKISKGSVSTTKTNHVIDHTKKGGGVVIDSGKKGGVVIDSGKKGIINTDITKKGIINTDITKKGVVTDLAKKNVGSQFSKVFHGDVFFKPQSNWGKWGGWWGSHHHGWWGGCGGWWGGCGGCWGGWGGGWCMIIEQPIIVEGPVDGSNNKVDGGDKGGAPDGDKAKPQFERFLKVKNDTGEKLTIFVQYIMPNDKGEPVWAPGEPGSDKAITLELEPGKDTYVEVDGKKLSSVAVRVWAVGEKGKYLDYKDQDLVLVPADKNGQHVYLATEVKTMTFVFSGETQTSMAPTQAKQEELVAKL
jgi:hypothetical protein